MSVIARIIFSSIRPQSIAGHRDHTCAPGCPVAHTPAYQHAFKIGVPA